MSQLIKAVSKTVTAATASGVATVDATDVIWPGQVGWLSKAGVNGQRVQVVEILTATTFRVRLLPTIKDTNFGKASSGDPAAYGASMFGDISNFSGGAATFNADVQVVPGNQQVAATSLTTVG